MQEVVQKCGLSLVKRGRSRQRRNHKRSTKKSISLSKGKTKKIPYNVFMINALFLNIRGVRTKKAIHRLKSLVKRNCIHYVAIFEPFIKMNKIEGYKKFLGFHHCISNDIG